MMQGPGLVFLLPPIAAFFWGSFCLSGAMAYHRVVSVLNPLLYGVGCGALCIGFFVPTGSVRAIGLFFLALVSISQAEIGLGVWRQGRTT